MMPIAMSVQSAVQRPARSRRGEAGWVLAATLILSSLVMAVTVTYARHAVLAKKSLEFAKGASEVEEASRSSLQRVRERMRLGDSPGTVAEGRQDEATMPTGEQVVGERQVLGHDEREIRARATSPTHSQDGEAAIRTRARVVPGSGSKGEQTRVRCEDGSTLLAGNLLVISGDVAYQGVELAGLMLLEEGAHLTLQDCVLRGTIVTRAGLCDSNAPITGGTRPRLSVYGGLRLLAGTELPDCAMAAPDCVFETDGTSSVEVRGFTCADEVKVQGHGCVRGMVVSGADEQIAPAVRRPGHGRGSESFPESIECGAEHVTRLAVPHDPISDATLDAMCSANIP